MQYAYFIYSSIVIKISCRNTLNRNITFLGPVFSVFATSLANDRLGGSSVEVWHLTLILSLLLAITVGFTSR